MTTNNAFKSHYQLRLLHTLRYHLVISIKRAIRLPIEIPKVMEKPPKKLIKLIIFGSLTFLTPMIMRDVVANPYNREKINILNIENNSL